MKRGDWQEKAAALKLALRWTYRASPSLTIVVFLLTILGGLLSVIEPYLFKLLIDFLVTGKQGMITIGLGIVGLIICYGFARTVQNLFWDVTNVIRRLFSLKLERYGVYELMKKISSLDLAYFEDATYYIR